MECIRSLNPALHEPVVYVFMDEQCLCLLTYGNLLRPKMVECR
jgi:hypothetical protein